MSRSTLLLASVPAAILLLGAPALAAQSLPPCSEQQAHLAVPASADSFGASVSLDGDVALIGAPGTNADTGRAYVAVPMGATWSLQAALDAASAAPGDEFGHSVAIAGSTAVVGAPRRDDHGTDSGAAFVFTRNGASWSPPQKLVAHDAGPDDRFGSSVAIFGDRIVVGAPIDDGAPGDSFGSAYVFAWNGGSWIQESKLLPSDGSAPPARRFGEAVAIDGATIVVGAPYTNGVYFESGTAYVYVHDGTSWNQQARLVDNGLPAHFGAAVSISGDTVAIGSPSTFGVASNSGVTYVFVRSGTSWSEQATLQASGGASFDRFGSSVSLSGHTLVVGAPGDDPPGSSSGSAYLAYGSVYVFVRGGASWSQQAQFTPDDGHEDGACGRSVSLDGMMILAGAPNAALVSGAAYVFGPPGESGSAYCVCPLGPCSNPDASAGCANSLGSGAALEARGVKLPDAVSLFVTRARPGQAAILLQGNQAVLLPFGDGFRCVAGGVVRITVPPLEIGVDGSVGWGPCFGGPTISRTTGVVPGSGVVKRYQCWYRDPGGPCSSGFNSSNAYEISW